VGSADHLLTEYVQTAMLTSCCPGTGPPGLLERLHDTDSTANMQSGSRFEERNFNPLTLELNPSAQRYLPRLFTGDLNF
jgi:hypothetical protein